MFLTRSLAHRQLITVTIEYGVEIFWLQRRRSFNTGDFILMPDPEWERLYAEYRELCALIRDTTPVDLFTFRSVVTAANRLRQTLISVNEEITKLTGLEY